LLFAAARADGCAHQHIAAAPIAFGHLEFHGPPTFQARRPSTTNPRLAPRVCRKSSNSGSVREDREQQERHDVGDPDHRVNGALAFVFSN
jgi:hypothetical protein